MPESRSSVYRGATREEAEAGYHADAKVAATAGYVPASEDWSVALGQQVLTVGYVFAPDQVQTVLEALAAAEGPSRQHLSPPVTHDVPVANLESTASASKGGRGVPVALVLLGIVLIGALAWQMGLFRSVTSAGGSAGNIPPSGQIWFGSSFDPKTFAVSGRTTTARTGSSVAMVAYLPRSVSSGDINLRVLADGTMIANQSVTMTGSGELFGTTVGPFYLAGSYRYEVTDIGGNVLASGTLTVTE